MILRLSYPLYILFFVWLLTACHSKKKVVKTPVKNNDTSLSVSKNLSQKIGVPEKEMNNKKLYRFIEDWYGTPYKFGGCEKSGVDCSCFANALYKDVYQKTLSRSSRDIYKTCEKINTSDLQEGDFVFFKINSQDVSHVGIYLSNNKFVHASTSKGVMVNDLNDAYYKKYFFTAARLK
jgi:murein DD-endopeptidase / murein LD-carboxypeptidase